MFFFGSIREITPSLRTKEGRHALQAKVLRAADKILPKSVEFRRGQIYPRAFRLAGPSEFIDTTENGLETLNTLMADGTPVLFIHTHATQRDSFEPIRHGFRKVPMMRRVPILYAISGHNYNERSEAITDLFYTELGVVNTKHSQAD